MPITPTQPILSALPRDHGAGAALLSVGLLAFAGVVYQRRLGGLNIPGPYARSGSLYATNIHRESPHA